MADLKPCPFCGESPIWLEEDCAEGVGYKIKCNNFECWICPETSYYSEKATAIEAWNTRNGGADNG